MRQFAYLMPLVLGLNRLEDALAEQEQRLKVAAQWLSEMPTDQSRDYFADQALRLALISEAVRDARIELDLARMEAWNAA